MGKAGDASRPERGGIGGACFDVEVRAYAHAARTAGQVVLGNAHAQISRHRFEIYRGTSASSRMEPNHDEAAHWSITLAVGVRLRGLSRNDESGLLVLDAPLPNAALPAAMRKYRPFLSGARIPITLLREKQLAARGGVPPACPRRAATCSPSMKLTITCPLRASGLSQGGRDLRGGSVSAPGIDFLEAR